jgi:branched-subunit amino acid aminotransferase/4-amino-4-deoxychorismate lyase
VSGSRAWTLVKGTFREGAVIPLTDRGFRYGMSVFETLAVRHGKILFLEQHLAALHAACADAGFRAEKIEALPALEGLPDGLLRVYVTAGDGTSSASEFDCRTFALFEPAEFPQPEEVGRGVRIGISQEPSFAVIGGWKTGNYWPRVKALARARENGLDEVLMQNSEGAVLSASMANVFFVFGSRVRTPPARLGARCGVVRAWVIAMMSVDESILSVEDIRVADECFLTNSRLGVMPVAEIEGHCLPSRSRGAAMAALYREKFLCA